MPSIGCMLLRTGSGPGHRFCDIRRAEAGNVAVFTALALTTIMLFVALAFDSGMLTLRKGRLQDAVEAAALAGVRRVGDPPPAVAAAVSALMAENGIETDDFDLSLGYYDEHDAYSDFPTYRDFASYAEGEIPPDVYPNAVLLTTHVPVATLQVRTGQQQPAQVGAQALAYLKRYAFIALGSQGMSVPQEYFWEPGYPVFRDASIHSNGSLQFKGTERFEGDTAVGAVYGATNATTATAGADRLDIAPVDWDALRDAAISSGGTVYYPEDWPTQRQTDDYGNHFFRQSAWAGARHYFVPAPGDHFGRVYYFALRDPAQAPSDMSLWINCDYETEVPNRLSWSFTAACEGDLTIRPYYNYERGVTLGQPGDGIVHLYAAGDVFFQDRVGGVPPAYVANGVVFRAGGQFTMYHYCAESDEPSYHRMRVIADSIRIETVRWGDRKGKIIFDGLFGPPCPPVIPGLGQLVHTSPP